MLCPLVKGIIPQNPQGWNRQGLRVYYIVTQNQEPLGQERGGPIIIQVVDKVNKYSVKTTSHTQN